MQHNDLHRDTAILRTNSVRHHSIMHHNEAWWAFVVPVIKSRPFATHFGKRHE
jgi:hypothetical protein